MTPCQGDKCGKGNVGSRTSPIRIEVGPASSWTAPNRQRGRRSRARRPNVGLWEIAGWTPRRSALLLPCSSSPVRCFCGFFAEPGPTTTLATRESPCRSVESRPLSWPKRWGLQVALLRHLRSSPRLLPEDRPETISNGSGAGYGGRSEPSLHVPGFAHSWARTTFGTAFSRAVWLARREHGIDRYEHAEPGPVLVEGTDEVQGAKEEIVAFPTLDDATENEASRRLR